MEKLAKELGKNLNDFVRIEHVVTSALADLIMCRKNSQRFYNIVNALNNYCERNGVCLGDFEKDAKSSYAAEVKKLK